MIGFGAGLFAGSAADTFILVEDHRKPSLISADITGLCFLLVQKNSGDGSEGRAAKFLRFIVMISTPRPNPGPLETIFRADLLQSWRTFLRPRFPELCGHNSEWSSQALGHIVMSVDIPGTVFSIMSAICVAKST